MRKSGLLVLLLTVILLAGCGLRTISGSGNVVTQEEAITAFDKVDISHAFHVDISQGDTFNVVVRVDDNLVKYLHVGKVGNTLQIGLVPNPPNIRSATLQAEVTMPELTGLELSGASHVTTTGFDSAQALVVDASGASVLRGDIQAGDVRFGLDGSSEVILTGSVENVTIKASGSSDADLSALSVVDANVEADGKSQVTVNASGKVDVNASNGAKVTYLGNPTLGRMETSGAASIEQK